MFSIYEDTVLDPFLGTGTTSVASAILGRNSMGYEVDHSLKNMITNRLGVSLKETSVNYLKKRLENHGEFIKNYMTTKNKSANYFNKNLKTSVITSQEKEMQFYNISFIETKGEGITCNYVDLLPALKDGDSCC